MTNETVERVVERVDDVVIEHTRTVVVAFLLLTVVFGAGLGNISTDSGTDQFTSDVPAQQAFEDVNREFSPSFAPGTAGTSLIQREQNVLAKPALLRMLEAQRALSDREDLRVVGTSSAAQSVARQLDPDATTLDAQIRAVEGATPGEIDAAVQQLAARPGFDSTVSTDFNAQAATASAAIGSVSHSIPGDSGGGGGGGPGGGGADTVTTIQLEAQHVVSATAPTIEVFGSGIINDEFGRVIFDSLAIVVPAASLFILLFLVVAYRDPVDLLLGVVSLVMAIVWTFGFMGLVGIPFSQMLIAVPPLLLAVGIDFGIHAVNRYREELQHEDMVTSMRVTLRQLLVAFFLVTGTTVIGFAANLTSSLGPIKDFGFVAAVGITFTFLVFGVFLPAAKLYTDQLREARGIPRIGQTPLGEEGSLLGRVLTGGVAIGRRAPVLFLVLVLVGSAGAGVYATGISTSFQQEDFLPPEETPAYLDRLPEPLAPGEYSATADLNFLSENFESGNQQSVTVYVEGPMERDTSLEMIHRAGADPPDSFVVTDRRAQSQSIVTVIQSYAAQDPEFRALVDRNDRDGDGIPDDNLGEVYAALESSPAGAQAERYLAEDHRSAQVVYTAEGDVEQAELTADGEAIADRFRYPATATGQTIVFQAVSDTIFASALRSLVIALALTAGFLVAIYRLITGYGTLGIVNLVPIVVTLALLAGSMRYFGIPFNALTATILSITIGLGIDYSVHVVHRFADEYEERPLFPALERTVQGTGGALTGSMLTTVTGIGVLVLAITPILGQFGVLTALSILYAYLTSLLVLPPALVVWARLYERFAGDDPGEASEAAGTDAASA
ncbi:efflux RND transporter permease subunit [Halomarina litorea]|uniref:efflux RND transporter permease subunit n=1 Tax=Halomarina litorea TaxID=2961595 RepID=UPI0020C29DB5|nr:MMPL family transporter [Halomarina sp. BCD28]